MGHITKTLAAFAATATLLAGASATAQAQSFMPTTGLSSQPIGHYEFLPSACRRECGATNAAGAQVDLTRELWAKIVEVNNLVNTMVTPVTDWEAVGASKNSGPIRKTAMAIAKPMRWRSAGSSSRPAFPPPAS